MMFDMLICAGGNALSLYTNLKASVEALDAKYVTTDQLSSGLEAASDPAKTIVLLNIPRLPATLLETLLTTYPDLKIVALYLPLSIELSCAITTQKHTGNICSSWQKSTIELIELQSQHPSRLHLVNATHASQNPQSFVTLVMDTFDISSRKGEPKTAPLRPSKHFENAALEAIKLHDLENELLARSNTMNSSKASDLYPQLAPNSYLLDLLNNYSGSSVLNTLFERQLFESHKNMNEFHEQIEQLKNEKTDLKKKIAHVQYDLDETRNNIAAMKASTSWKISFPIRLFGKIKFYLRTRTLKGQIDLLNKSELFDEKWYREKYPDVSSTDINAAKHYLKYGSQELRSPGPYFSTAFYLEHNSDVQANKLNPLIHYIVYGQNEGRPISGVS